MSLEMNFINHFNLNKKSNTQNLSTHFIWFGFTVNIRSVLKSKTGINSK